jgi:AMP-binding enzyme C-terminal domain
VESFYCIAFSRCSYHFLASHISQFTQLNPTQLNPTQFHSSSGGENISSIEVEAVLLTHHMIDEAAVIAVADEKWGEVPCAFVTLRTDSAVQGVDPGSILGDG